MVQNKLSFGQSDLPSINMPSFVGLRPIIFDEEDFDLVHEYIAEHEFHEYRVHKKIELQGKKSISDSMLRGSIYHKLRERFYKGQRVTWISLNADHAITRREESEITSNLRQMLHDRQVGDKTEPAKYIIYHSGGAGATTLARKILWHLRKDFPCVILKSNYKHSEDKVKNTSQTLKNLYEKLKSPIVMLIDEEPSFKTIPRLTSCIQANGTPIVFLQVQRCDPSELEQDVKHFKDSYTLPGALHKDDANKLKEKLFVAFQKIEVSVGDHSVAKMESSVAKPTEGGQVTDLEQNGIITKITYKKTGLISYYTINVLWENDKEEVCCVGSYDPSIKHRFVYLKTEVTTKINRLYETFHFYGIMYLDEEFCQPMYEHIKKRLNVVLSHNKVQDEAFKNQLLVLAYLSVLFAFKVCESIHIKAFERLYYSVTKSNRTEKFKLEAFIPKASLEFMIITCEGQFRITHPIVASEIIKFCSTVLSFSVHYPPSFICNFLDFTLPDKDDQNEEVALAVNRLLFYREYFDGGGYLIMKHFSELILTLDKQNQDHALTVLDYASELISDCHSYGHYARYVSTNCKDHVRALGILKQAENLAFRSYEEGLVLNIKGDIYRARLENQLGQAINSNWRDNIEVFDSHFNSCHAYREAHKANLDVIPLFNEITVRLRLLKAIKGSKGNREFLKFLNDISEAEVSGSINTCLQIVKELNELLLVEEETDFDSGDKARLKLLEVSLLDIIGSNKNERKKILLEVMKKYSNHVNLPSITRSWIQLCLFDAKPTPEELDICYNALEENFKVLGHVDRDMRNWLLVTRHMPDIGGNITKIEEKLCLWKTKGPCINTGKRTIQATNNPIWVNFYLSVCYFIQLIETKEEKVDQLVKKFNNANQALLQVSEDEKSQHRIREWVCNDETGFGCLKAGQIVQGEMKLLKGSVTLLQSKRQKRPRISWIGLLINFNSKKYSNQPFKQGESVLFGVGFTFRGPQAMVLTELASSVPNSPNKVISENDQQQSLPVTQSYSQAVYTSMKKPKK